MRLHDFPQTSHRQAMIKNRLATAESTQGRGILASWVRKECSAKQSKWGHHSLVERKRPAKTHKRMEADCVIDGPRIRTPTRTMCGSVTFGAAILTRTMCVFMAGTKDQK
jgi:hypothetical protein